MNPTFSSDFATGLAQDLQAFLKLGEQVLALTASENQALTGQNDYSWQDFHQRRKDLLPGLESVLLKLRARRQLGINTGHLGQGLSGQTKTLFQVIQNLLMRILLLDHQNQQALLQRGLVPRTHLPAGYSFHPGTRLSVPAAAEYKRANHGGHQHVPLSPVSSPSFDNETGCRERAFPFARPGAPPEQDGCKKAGYVASLYQRNSRI